jgi:predicted O-methyltransferase YrrM
MSLYSFSHPWWKNSHEVLSSIQLVQEELEKVKGVHAINDFDYNYKLKNKKFPYSCTDEEGLLLYFTIIENGLKSGFEIATAFGYSSCFIGLAMKKNAGHLISVDCYIEEFKENYHYSESEIAKLNLSENVPEGLSFARRQAKKLKIDDVVDFKIGISPYDIPKLIDQPTLDFVFIDGGHFGEQPTKDFLAVSPYLSKKCAVIFHDNNFNPYVFNAIKVAEDMLKSKAIRTNTRYNITLVGRDLSSQFIKQFKQFSKRPHLESLQSNFDFFVWQNKQMLKKLLRSKSLI